ncbi:hypothetical protein PCANC_09543 [Puccinia coronata f. sp. avenae]|nr:hypothetical protein PCANC_09543 [Puccinia coronata f. sp. avenae]
MCTHLSKLSVRYETTSGHLDEHGNFIIDPLHPMSRLLDPISQLSNLTYLTLRNHNTVKLTNRTGHAWNNWVFLHEEFVIKLIRNMRHLVFIHLERVEGGYENCDFPETDDFVPDPSLSPLAVHLASLPSLKFLYFTQMPSFDTSWSQIKWKGALEGFTLRKTFTVLRAVHAFCNMFADSLIFISLYLSTLILENNRGPLTNALPSELDCFLFRLPNLKRLSICTELPYMILKLFRESHNIFRISLMNIPENRISVRDIKSIINRDTSPWRHLKSVLIHIEQGSFSFEEMIGLQHDGLEAGVRVECGTLKRRRQPFFEEDHFFSDGDATTKSSSSSTIEKIH